MRFMRTRLLWLRTLAIISGMLLVGCDNPLVGQLQTAYPNASTATLIALATEYGGTEIPVATQHAGTGSTSDSLDATQIAWATANPHLVIRGTQAPRKTISEPTTVIQATTTPASGSRSYSLVGTQAVRTTNSAGGPLMVYYSLARLNIRSGPGMEYEMVGGFAVCDQVEVIGTEGAWLKVNNASGQDAYVHADYVSDDSDRCDPALASAETSRVAVTTDPNFAGTTRKIVYQGAAVQVIDSRWTHVIGNLRSCRYVAETVCQPRPGPDTVFLLLRIQVWNEDRGAAIFNGGEFRVIDGLGEKHYWDVYPHVEDQYSGLISLLEGETTSGWWLTQIADNPEARANLVLEWFTDWKDLHTRVLLVTPIRSGSR